ncbi:DUF1659 domain-containing protein [Marinisporobacter balticus]|uniref:Uncharacterized protein DUF1659 n=1 Tax=Marinisporobacter balticus TaxID=2018667 RepID=A0A4R2K7B8_9FIRM|nr:DUF1659 domain-containing protein [Marinisporobacter balticus]TCO69231.1 uncharacterized protein DUF1659 [Marinisporobacter balticus]
MAISAKSAPSHLAIVFDNGVDEKGKAKKKTKSYSSVKSAATNENMHAVAKVLIGLQSNTALEILRKDESELREA